MTFINFIAHAYDLQCSSLLNVFCSSPADIFIIFLSFFLTYLLSILLLCHSVTVRGVSNGGIQGPLRYTVSERIFLAQKFHKIFNFFSGANGSLDVMDGVLTLLALALSQEKEGGQTEGEQSGRGSVTALTSADVAAVMAVVRSPHHRLILHERSEVFSNCMIRMSVKFWSLPLLLHSHSIYHTLSLSLPYIHPHIYFLVLCLTLSLFFSQ